MGVGGWSELEVSRGVTGLEGWREVTGLEGVGGELAGWRGVSRLEGSYRVGGELGG